MALTVGSLFSGIGGLELGLERTGYFKTKWQVEIDPYARKVLEKQWPTPRANKVHPKLSENIARRNKGNLEEAVAKTIWPTPTKDSASNRTKKYKQGGTPLTVAVKMFPTPRGATEGVGMCGGTGAFAKLKSLEEQGQITEAERKAMAAGNGGALNPTWVEWLMGFPGGWTDLSASETP